MVEIKKFLDQSGVETLWSKVLEQDYSSNKALMAAINAVDEVKADRDELPDVSGFQPKGNYLTEHQPIKTINGQSLIGIGNLILNGSNNTDATFLFYNPLQEGYYNRLNYVAIGDSITQGVGASKTANGYATLVSNRLNTFLKNAGSSGYTFESKYPDLDAIEEIKYADLITIALGVNDFSQRVQLGTLGEDNINTIYGRVKMWCDKLLEIIENGCSAKIIFLTPLQCATAFNEDGQLKPNASGVTLRQICDAIIETCAMYKFPVIDMYKYSGIYYNNANDNNLSTYLGDGLHPNDSGHALMAEKVYDYIMKNPIYLSSSEIVNLWLLQTYPNYPITLPSKLIQVAVKNAYNTKGAGYQSLFTWMEEDKVFNGANILDLVNYTYSDYYRVEPNTTYNLTKTNFNITAGNFYNESKAHISTIPKSTVIENKYYQFTTPMDCAYIRVACRLDEREKFTLLKVNENGDVELELTKITASYNGGNVLVGTNINTIPNIVVKAHYSDGSSKTISDYTMSGVIAEGDNVITIMYQDLSATITITGIIESRTLDHITATYNGSSVPIHSDIEDLRASLIVTAYYNDNTVENVDTYTLYGEINEGNNTIIITYSGQSTTIIVVGVTAIPDKPVESISVKYQGHPVPFNSNVKDLSGITVIATYEDGTSAPITGFSIAGNCTEHINPITVTYGDKQATFLAVARLDDATLQSAELNWIDNGQYINDNGTLGDLATFSHSDYYPVSPGETYTFTGGEASVKGCFYDKNKEYVSSVASSQDFIHAGNDGTFTVPATVAYVRLNCVTKNKASFKLEKIADYIVTDDLVTTWVEKDKIANSGDKKATLANYAYSDLIPIEAGATYQITQIGMNINRYNLFDKNGTYVSAASGNLSAKPLELTVPEDVGYIRVSTNLTKGFINFKITKIS